MFLDAIRKKGGGTYDYPPHLPYLVLHFFCPLLFSTWHAWTSPLQPSPEPVPSNHLLCLIFNLFLNLLHTCHSPSKPPFLYHLLPTYRPPPPLFSTPRQLKVPPFKQETWIRSITISNIFLDVASLNAVRLYKKHICMFGNLYLKMLPCIISYTGPFHVTPCLNCISKAFPSRYRSIREAENMTKGFWMSSSTCISANILLRPQFRWEFIIENKKVRKQENKNSTKKAIKKTRKQERKQELDQESDQEKKKNFLFFLFTFLVEFLYSCFLL